MNIRIMSKFFSLLFLFSCTFIAEAAKIIFLNFTGESLTIEYNGENFVIGVDGEHTIESTMWKKYAPGVTNKIDGNDFRFKIGEGEFRAKHFDNSKDPKGTDTGSAISGNNTRYLEIRGYNDEDITIFSQEDELGLNKFLLEKAYSCLTNSIRNKFDNYMTLKPGEKVNISRGYALSGTIKNPHLEDENISIRKLGNKKSIASAGEIVSVNHRMRVVREKQENFLEDKFKDYEIPLSIGFAGSGGGVRARLSTTGFVKGAIDTGLLDCITYFSALSGSSWMLAPWIMRKDGTSIESFIECVINDSTKEKTMSIKDFIGDISIKCISDKIINFLWNDSSFPKLCPDLIKRDFRNQTAWNRPNGMVNAFGQMLKEIFLNDLVSEEDYENLYLSNMREKLENGSTFIPVFEIRAEKTPKRGKGSILEPCFFTPWEFGSRYFGKNGACINIKTFGSRFTEKNKAELVNISNNVENYYDFGRGTFLVGPEPGLELIMATCGSAFTCSPSFAVTGVAKQNTDENIHKTRNSAFDESLINCEFNNFMQNDKDFVGFYDKKRLRLHDAGLIANIPVDSLYRRPEDIAHGVTEGSAPDIIFIFDASDTQAGTLGEELIRNKIEMKKKGLPFPDIRISKDNDKILAPEIIKTIRDTAFYIFDENPDKGKPENEKQFHDWQIPTIIYMTLVDEKKASTGKNINSNNFTFNFNNFPTFNFKYDRKACNGLITLTGKIIRDNLEAIKIAMKKRRILNLERYLWSIDNAERNKDKLLNYCNEIDNNNNNIKQKNCTLQIKVKDLNKEKKAISGLLENEQREEEINDEIKRIEKEISKNIVIENQNEKLTSDICNTIHTDDADCIRIKEEIVIEKEKINKEEKDYNNKLKTNNNLDSSKTTEDEKNQKKEILNEDSNYIQIKEKIVIEKEKINKEEKDYNDKLKTNNNLDSSKTTEDEKNQKKEMLNNIIFYIDLEDNFFEILRKEGTEKVFLKKALSKKTKTKILKAINFDKCNLDNKKGIGIIFEPHKTCLHVTFKSGLYGQYEQLKNDTKIKKIFIKYLKNLDIDTPKLKQKVKKILIEKDFLQNKASAEPKKSVAKPVETPLESKWPISKPVEQGKSEKSASKIKVEELVNFAETNNMFIGEDTFKVKDTTNNVYQLIVDGQPEGNTCGPRACFNCLKFIEYFDKSYNKGAKEISENFRSNKNALNFLSDAAKTLNIKKGFPIDLNMYELEQIKGNNIKIFEGYEDFNVPGFEVVNLEAQKEGFFTGFVFKKGIVENGYTQSEAANIFVDPKGLMKSNGNPIGDHWICLFVVKTGKKEYSWFIADSLNTNRVKEHRITAYIHKLFGQDYEPYDDFMVKEKEKVDKRTELELITIISRMIDNTSDKEIKETITRQYGVINGKKIPDTDVFNRFLAEKIINISAMKYADQKMKNDLIEKIIKNGRGVNGEVFLKKLNEDTIELNKLVETDMPGIVLAKEIIEKLKISGYPEAENIKTVIIENINNTFSDKIKKRESILNKSHNL